MDETESFRVGWKQRRNVEHSFVSSDVYATEYLLMTHVNSSKKN